MKLIKLKSPLFALKHPFFVRPCKTGKFPLRPQQNDYGN